MADQPASGETWAERLFPDELIHVVGHVVMAAASVEDKAGELVQLSSMLSGTDAGAPAPGWAASGTALLKKLRAVAPEELVDRLDAALARRNFVVHGVALSGEAFVPQGTDATGVWAFMKRHMGPEVPAKFSIRGWSIDQLDALARELSSIEDGLDDEVSYAMGLTARPTAQ